MLARTARRLAGALLVSCLLLGSPPAVSAAAPDPVSPADAALTWLGGELAARDGMLTVTFGVDEFPDPGLTIDAILAALAGGRAGDPAVVEAVAAVDAATLAYVTQQSSFPADRAANATAKALLLQEVLGTDLGGPVDLEADLRALMATTGDEVGRFNDTDLQGFGNYANGLGQALAVLALDRTAGGVPPTAIDFLLDQQCANGGFRLYYFGYITSFDPFETVPDLTCTDPGDADVDATALALGALRAAPPSPATATAIDDAVAYLLGAQLPSGGFTGTGATNANTTGLAGQALRGAGELPAADAAAGFLAGLQARSCADLGALAYDQAGFDAGVDADRDQWIRATTQGVLGLGLPGYGDIGSVPPAPAGLEPIACPTDPPSGGAATVTASAASVTVGGSLSLTATGFQAGETVDATLRSTPVALGAFEADAAGTLTATVTIPADVEPGDHTIELVGRTSGRRATVAIEVLGRAIGGAALPATGRRDAPLAGAGAALVLVGAALVALARRRSVATGSA